MNQTRINVIDIFHSVQRKILQEIYKKIKNFFQHYLIRFKINVVKISNFFFKLKVLFKREKEKIKKFIYITYIIRYVYK